MCKTKKKDKKKGINERGARKVQKEIENTSFFLKAIGKETKPKESNKGCVTLWPCHLHFKIS
jgi:hypothetical protein